MLEIFVWYFKEDIDKEEFLGGFISMIRWSDGVFFYVSCFLEEDGIFVKVLYLK